MNEQSHQHAELHGPLAIEKLAAVGATGDRAIGGQGEELQHHLAPGVEARLAKIMRGFNDSFTTVIAAQLWQLEAVSKLAESDLEKRVAATLCKSLIGFFQFTSSVAVLAIKLEQGSLEVEERIVRLEEFAVHLGDLTGHLIPVPKAHRTRADILGEPQGIDGGTNQ